MTIRIAPPPAPHEPSPEERKFVNELLARERASGDPLSFAEPLSDSELEQKRRLTLSNAAWSSIGKFTCDDCEARRTCLISFDPQNTHGVCVLKTDLLKAPR